MIIYMGVGMPIVQSRCYKCADRETNEALLAVVEISASGCACGCMNEVKKPDVTDTGCACGTGKPVQETGDSSCSIVKIQKLNLPTLGTSLHLDNVVLPVINLIFSSYNINLDLLSSVKKESIYADSSQHRQPPRGYLNLICTLLI
ncbi:hypothetical protein [Phocaeicola sp.]